MESSNCRERPFTLLELMIVVAIIAVIASVAIPRLMAARRAANESAAISTLRSIRQAEEEIRSFNTIDTDGNGNGEYAYLAELAGVVPIRVGRAEPEEGFAIRNSTRTLLDPPLLATVLGTFDERGLLVRNGYVFRVFLPGPGSQAVGIPEDTKGGKEVPPYPDAGNSEHYWCAYAWPVVAGQTGDRAFFVNQDGAILQTEHTRYSGPTNVPAFDAAYSVSHDMTGPHARLHAADGGGSDGRMWAHVN